MVEAEAEKLGEADGETSLKAEGKISVKAEGETAVEAEGETAVEAEGETSVKADGEISTELKEETSKGKKFQVRMCSREILAQSYVTLPTYNGEMWILLNTPVILIHLFAHLYVQKYKCSCM